MIAIGEGSITQLVVINEDNTINISSTSKNNAIKKVDNSSNKVDDMCIINTDNTRSVIVK